MSADGRDEVIELLQQLIRNQCVNDGTQASGHEIRSVESLESYLAGSGFELQRFEPVPGRASLVARFEGRDPSAPSLMLMGHTDVVPANPAGWSRDPFGGDLADGYVWGRGSVDMLCETASMAVACKKLGAQGWRPRGTLIYLAVADEEAGGNYGSRWLIEHAPKAVKTDFLLTELGGVALGIPGASRANHAVDVAEKGLFWRNVRVHGTPGHGSMPRRTGNALVKAAEVIRRIAEYRPQTQIHETWRRFVHSAGLPSALARSLADPTALRAFIDGAPDEGFTLLVRASTQTTFAPTVVHGGVKTNIIPDTVDLQVDIRTLPGETADDVRRHLDEALGDLAADVEITSLSDNAASASKIDTPLWDSVARATEALAPGHTTIPFLLVGTTDARFFRPLGTVAYGAGLFSPKTSFVDLVKLIHGDDERIDVESLHLLTDFWQVVAKDLLG